MNAPTIADWSQQHAAQVQHHSGPDVAFVQKSRRPEPPFPAPAPHPTILVVDDSEDDLFLMRTAFRRASCPCSLREVQNGEEAIAYLAGDGPYRDRNTFPMPTLLLLDLNLPMKNGFDVLEWMRRQTGLECLPVIVLSASARPSDQERALELGADSYLVKPSTLDDLTRIAGCLRDWLEPNQSSTSESGDPRPMRHATASKSPVRSRSNSSRRA